MAHICKLTEIEYLEDELCVICSNKLFYDHHIWCGCKDKNVKKLTCIACEEIKQQISALYVELDNTLQIFNKECKYSLTINAELYVQLQEITHDIIELRKIYMVTK